jgi:hypothetical protein
MIFNLNGKTYYGESALEIVRAVEMGATEYDCCGGPIRQFLLWSLNQPHSGVPPRELDLSETLPDEPLSLSYLCLLDECGVGTFWGDSLNPKSEQIRIGGVVNENN